MVGSVNEREPSLQGLLPIHSSVHLPHCAVSFPE